MRLWSSTTALGFVLSSGIQAITPGRVGGLTSVLAFHTRAKKPPVKHNTVQQQQTTTNKRMKLRLYPTLGLE